MRKSKCRLHGDSNQLQGVKHVHFICEGMDYKCCLKMEPKQDFSQVKQTDEFSHDAKNNWVVIEAGMAQWREHSLPNKP